MLAVDSRLSWRSEPVRKFQYLIITAACGGYVVIMYSVELFVAVLQVPTFTYLAARRLVDLHHMNTDGRDSSSQQIIFLDN